MTKSEAEEILELLYVAYPNFNKHGMKSFNRIWMEQLMEGDYQKTLRKTKKYCAESPYPPSFADVFVPIYKPVQTHDAEMLAEAAKKVEEEKKDPKLQAERERKINEMMRKLKGLDADG